MVTKHTYFIFYMIAFIYNVLYFHFYMFTSGIVTCDPCCRHKAYIPHFDDKNEVNVCNKCFQRYMKRGMEWLKKTKQMAVSSKSTYSSSKSNYSDDEHKQIHDEVIPAQLSPVTKRRVEHQLKLHHEMVRGSASDTSATTLSQGSITNKCCVKCDSEFNLLKPKRTCMNW